MAFFKRELSRASTFHLFLVTFFEICSFSLSEVTFQYWYWLSWSFRQFWSTWSFFGSFWSWSVIARACRLEVFSVLFAFTFLPEINFKVVHESWTECISCTMIQNRPKTLLFRNHFWHFHSKSIFSYARASFWCIFSLFWPKIVGFRVTDIH